MSTRHLVSFAFLGLVFAFAGVLAMGWTMWWLTPVHWLSRYQLFHVVAHFSIFAGVVFLYHPRRYSDMWLWGLILGGSVLLEIIQITVGGFRLSKLLLIDCFFDIVVDIAGATVCWFMVTQRHRRFVS